MSDDIAQPTSSVRPAMADPEDQEMILDQISLEKDSLETRGQQDDSRENALKTFLHSAFQEHATKYQLCQPYNLLHGFFLEHWDKLGVEYQKFLDTKSDIAEEQRFELSRPPSADLGQLKLQIADLRVENADLKEDGRKRGEALLAKESSLKKLDEEQKALESELTAKTKQLNGSKKDIAQLKKDLSWKTQKLRKMHAIFAESGQEKDPYDDRHFTEKFETLWNDIQHLVKKHFPATLHGSDWKEYDEVRRADDRDFFLQAKFATVLAQSFFNHDKQIFGLGYAEEENLAAFEQLLQGYHVPQSEIVDWRIQTIKVAAIMNGEHRKNPKWELPSELSGKLKDVHKHVSRLRDWASAEIAIHALMDSAYNLALALRSCRVEYEWDQTVSPTSLEPMDVDRIEDYDVRSRPTGQPVKILFGPVYKRVNSKLELLRQGTVLYS